MDKYEVLEEKLIKIIECIDMLKVDNESNKKYLVQYREYVSKLITITHNKKIRASNGALLGLIRGISDYDELCACEKLWKCVTDADNYYSNECKIF